MIDSPLTINFGSTPKSLNRTGTGQDTGGFASGDRAVRLSIAHAYGKRSRRVAKMQSDTLVPNPLIAGQNISQSASVHLVVDTPAGYASATAKEAVMGFLELLTGNSGEIVDKLLGGES